MIYQIPKLHLAGIGLLAFFLVVTAIFSYTNVNSFEELIEMMFQVNPDIPEGSEISKLIGFVKTV